MLLPRHLPLRDLFVLLAVLAVAVTTFLAAARVAIGWLHRRFVTHSPVPRRFRWWRRTVVVLAVGGLVCMAYARFVEPYWLAVRRVTLASAKIPPSCRPIRIVHISDLHSDANPRLEEKLPEVVASLNPDVIAFTGDACNGPEGLPNFRRCMARLALIAPTYEVRGNWDGTSGLYTGTGVKELDGVGVCVEVASARLWLSGLPAYADDRIASALESKPADAYSVFLYHSPDGIFEFTKRGVDLVLSGHTHGGQVALPFYGAVITLSSFGKRFEGGFYQLGDTAFNVSRGIGMEGGRFVPRLRFLARPEITLIEVAPAK